MLNWSKQFDIFLLLDSNGFADKHSRYEMLAAAGAAAIVQGSKGDQLQALQQLHEERKDWLFGHIAYDYKNNLEKNLYSPAPVRTGWESIFFFCPAVVCTVNTEKDTLTIECLDQDPDEVYHAIQQCEAGGKALAPIQFSQRTVKNNYLEKVRTLRQHIKDGDCYEVNLCCEGFAEDVQVSPPDIYPALNTLSPAPFAAYYRNKERYMICASIERYLRKEHDIITSQPIKGTAKRDKDASRDAEIKEALSNSIKDRAENVMIVDLVRNDLARCCEVGSVSVDELCQIYSFPQVHQMISTISGKLVSDKTFTDAIRYSFPMGSMTGAPKIKVMKLISRYEDARRELFSGTVGYITPDGDFDLNVIIRSIFYNEETQYLSYQTGGAITYDSDPEQEWEEMRLKAWALERVFMTAE